MKPITKKELIKTVIALVLLTFAIITTANFLGNSRIQKFKSKGIITEAKVLNKRKAIEKNGSVSSNTYVLEIQFATNDSVNGISINISSLEVDKLIYENTDLNQKIKVVYVIDNIDEVELYPVVFKP